MTRMNPAVKTRWLAALRSDDHVQGRGALHRFDAEGFATFCCLGVLCHLAARDDVVDVQLGGRRVTYGSEGDDGVLPFEVMTWAGLDDADPTVDGLPLTALNDGNHLRGVRARSFTELANLIEEHL